MRIEETICENNLYTEPKDPYEIALKFMQKASSLGKVFERKNVYSTDGPTNKTELEFDIVKSIDEFSRINIYVIIEGESNARKYLRINIKASFVVEISESTGVFTETLQNYYMSVIFSKVRKTAKDEINYIVNSLEAYTENVKIR